MTVRTVSTALGIQENTPAWLYMLIEAQLDGGQRLGPTASHIIADTIVGLTRQNPASVLRYKDGNWYPCANILKDKNGKAIDSRRSFLLFATEDTDLARNRGSMCRGSDSALRAALDLTRPQPEASILPAHRAFPKAWLAFWSLVRQKQEARLGPGASRTPNWVSCHTLCRVLLHKSGEGQTPLSRDRLISQRSLPDHGGIKPA